MGDRQHDNVELLVRQFGEDFQTVFAPYIFRPRPGIIDRHADPVITEVADDIADFGVAHIGTVFLEGKT